MFKGNWSKQFAWIALLLCTAIAAVLSNLIVDAAADKDISGIHKSGLIVLGVVAVLSGLVATGDAPWQEPDFKAWLRPRPIAMTFVAMFGAFGLLTGVISLNAPRGSVESEKLKIERGVDDLKRDVAGMKRDLGKLHEPDALIRRHIGGLWGLVGSKCTRTLKFTLAGDALTIEGVGEPDQAPHYRAVATVTAIKDKILESRGVSGNGKGIASTFTYTGNAQFEALAWKDQSDDVPPTELERCRA